MSLSAVFLLMVVGNYQPGNKDEPFVETRNITVAKFDSIHECDRASNSFHGGSLSLLKENQYYYLRCIKLP